MPHFYFDVLENGELLHDKTGLVLKDLEAAKAEARKALGDMMREEIRTVRPKGTREKLQFTFATMTLGRSF